MIRGALPAAVLIVATPVLAQDQAVPAGGVAATEPQQATPGASDIASIVDSEFPAYDADQSGQLEQDEFTKWMVALKDEEMKATGKTIAPAEVATWASGAFASADTDKSANVSKDELVTYLSGGAA